MGNGWGSGQQRRPLIGEGGAPGERREGMASGMVRMDEYWVPSRPSTRSLSGAQIRGKGGKSEAQEMEQKELGVAT